MKNNSFAHLHLHNEYSYLDGYGSAKKYIAKAKRLSFNYIALTNHGNIDGLLQWQRECDKQDIHPVLGCEAYIVPDRFVKQKEKRGHISLLVKNETGWKTLCAILTEANLTGFYHKPRIDYNLLLNSDLSGLIIMTACAGSFLNLPEAEKLMVQLFNKIPGNLYFEIMPHDIDSQHILHNRIKVYSEEFPDIPFVATNDCHYIEPDEWEAQEMLLAINSHAKWNDPKRWKFGFKGLHLRTAQEMINAFQRQGDWPEEIVKQAMANTIKIARQCFRFRIPKQEISLPRSPLAKNVKNEAVLLDSICKEGYEKIFKNNNWPQEYKDRYLEEFKLIKKKKFERYFLIVYDLINWARDNDIAVGPGRGSVSGSLIAFLMGITQVNPIKFKLSFSRFISEDRIDWPDIDIDFEKRYRGKVVKYLEETYGKYNTCSISTDMKMQSKAAIRDVCRVMDIPSKTTNSFANSIWNGEHKNDSAIQSSIDNTKEGKYFAKKYPDTVRLALKMEGQCRGSGAHAAAVIISKEDLTQSNKCVLIKRNNRIVCNWNMEDSEYVGLMKLDVLGLSTLSVLSEAKRLINKKDNPKRFYYYPETKKYLFLNIIKRELEEKYKNCEQIDFDFNKIPLENEETFKTISDGKTSGMFQLSGHACTELCKKMKVHSFEDIAAVNALARPGPADSGMTEKYAKRKHGEKWKRKHPIYEKVTKDTYGIVIYQEQIMQVISKVAGLSESIADKIRKIIAKKKGEKKLSPYWKQFKNGCKKMKTFSQKEAEDFWEELKNHASYSFNRSHSVAYALIGWWTAFLKTHCFKEFASASLTYGEWNEKAFDSNKHKNSLLAEIRQAEYTIMPPKREYSGITRWQFHDDKLYIPFTEITGVGESNAAKCLEPVKQNKLQGFFGSDYNANEKQDTKLNQLLNELEVNKPDIIPLNKVLSKYLPHIDFKGEERKKYPNLIKTIGSSIPEKDLDDFLALNINPGGRQDNIIQRKRFRLEKQIFQCNRCGLRKQVKKRPVLSSTGFLNVAIVLEAPGKTEDEESKGAVGQAGDVLWNELAKYKYFRRTFHLTNACRCFVDPNTEIITSDGVKAISNIKISDLVLTHKGKFKKVKWILPKTILPRRSKMVVINYKFNTKTGMLNPTSIKVTPEHPFLIQGKDSKFNRWKNAEDIKIGDQIKVLGKQCPGCKKLFPLYSKKIYCSSKCGTAHCNRIRYWTKESRQKVSSNMQRLYKTGIINKNTNTQEANKATRLLVKNGKHFFQNTMLEPWRSGKTKYNNEIVAKSVKKSTETNRKNGHLKKLAQIGTGALKKYYETHKYKIPSKHKFTKIEQIMAWALKKRGHKDFIQNEYLKGYYPDILFPKHKLIIECNGTYWHHNEKAKKRDAKRDLNLEQEGYTTLRFTDKEIEKDIFQCVDKVERILKNHNEEYKFIAVEVTKTREITTDKTYRLYNFEVEEDSSYIANGLVSHNCWPSKSKTPNYIEIAACYKWLYYELNKIECRLILACGNVPLYALTGKKSGITDLSGTTEWVEEIRSWVCFCVHPSAVLRNRKQNLEVFQDGVKNFVEKLELLKGNK